MKLIARCFLAIAVAAFTLTSCGEDEVPKIGFTSNSSEVVEGSTVSVPLSVAIPSGVTPIVAFTGTATEDVDFTWAVSAAGDELVFETFADNTFDDETIIIEITGFNGSANVGSTVTHTVNISDPGLFVELTWTKQDGGTADLDLILLRETFPGSGNYTEVDASDGTAASESLVLRGTDTNAKYAVAVDYYGGSSDDVDFTLTLSTTAGTVNTSTKEIAFNGSLTQYHQDADTELSNVTFTKNNFSYSGFSSLFVDTPLDISLSWNSGSVDMDLYLSYLNPATGLYESVVSASGSDLPETVTLPGDARNGTYALRYKYYSGSSDALSFTATFALNEGGSFAGTANNTLAFNGVYTLANVNSGGSSSTISQTFVKNGTSFTTFSSITIPVSGSGAQFDDSSLADKKNSDAKQMRSSNNSVKREKGAKDATLNLNR